MTDPVSRRYAHFEGITYLCFDSNMRVVTCGHDCDVRIVEGNDSTEFSVSSDKLSAIVCYHNQDRQDVVAVAMDDYSVQAFKLDVKMNNTFTHNVQETPDASNNILTWLIQTS